MPATRPADPQISSLLELGAELAALGQTVLDKPPLSHLPASTLVGEALTANCVGLFATRQVSLMNAVLHLNHLGLAYASISVCRTMFEVAVRLAWLAREDTDPPARVTQWYATAWIDAYCTNRDSIYWTDSQTAQLKDRALASVCEHMGAARSTELAAVLDADRPPTKLNKHFDPYSGQTLIPMVKSVFGDEAAGYQADYAGLSSYVHLNLHVTDASEITEQTEEAVHVVDDPNPPEVAIRSLVDSIRWLVMLLEDADAILSLSIACDLKAFGCRYADVWAPGS